MKIRVALIALAFLAACGGDDNASPNTAAAVADGARYQAIAEPVNCAIGAAIQQTNSPDITWTDLRSIAGDLAKTEGHFVEEMTAERWPPQARPAVDRLVAAVSQQAARWREASSKTTEAEVLEAISRIDPNSAGSAPADVRKALGLEPLSPDAPPCPGHGG